MKYFPELDEERYQSMAAVPVASRSGEVIGVIVLHTVAPHEFGEEVVGLLTHTASLVGGAIENAQLYEQARRRVRALTQLAGASQRLAAATEHARLYEAATAGARALLDGELCQLFRLDGAHGELRLVASDPPGSAGAAAARAARCCSSCSPAPATAAARATSGPATRARRSCRRRSWPRRSSSACCACSAGRSRRFGPGDEELLARAGRPDRDGHGARRADRAADLARPRQGPLPGAGGRRVRRRRPARGARRAATSAGRTSW